MIKKTHLGIYGIIEKDHSILLVHKNRGPYKGLLDLPGGRIEHGESLFQALKREIKEEVNIEIYDAILMKNVSFQVDYFDGENAVSFHHIGLIYRIKNFDFQDYTQIHFEDVNGSRWISKNDLQKENLSQLVREAISQGF